MITSTNLIAPSANPPKIGAGAEVPAPSSPLPASSEQGKETSISPEHETARRKLAQDFALARHNYGVGREFASAQGPEQGKESEPEQVTQIFVEMLRAVSNDGATKRHLKEPWWRDSSHMAGVFSHFRRYFAGELVDPDSGAHPLVHAAWRLLAIAWQQTQGKISAGNRRTQGKEFHSNAHMEQ